MVRIGGASGFWGDSALGAPQLVRHCRIDYLVFDYLAELTMSLLAQARLKKPELGYATDFISVAMRQVLREVVERGIKVVSNAGGVNPEGCAQALQALAQELGVTVRVAVVQGDDVMPQIEQLREQGIRGMAHQADQPLPTRLASANAYLGAQPIREALDAGAQIVITGRCVDSAVTLGVLMHAFNWRPDDLDRMAAGSLAGHIIECGCQATGGLHTDWDRVPDWPNIGYPVIECEADGSFTVTKPEGTGGLITPAVVGEQMLYEIGDPSAYVLPDVTCDFTQVRIAQSGPQRVRVSGARGRPAPTHYKVSATYLQGYRASAQITLIGWQAAAKARRTGEAILARTRAMLQAQGLGDYSEHLLEVLGTESCFGPHARVHDTREAILRLTVTHADKKALELFAREVAPAGTSWSPGTTGVGGRPSVSPSIRQYAFLLPKTRLAPRVQFEGQEWAATLLATQAEDTEDTADTAVTRAPEGSRSAVGAGPEAAHSALATSAAPTGDTLEVPLIRLAWARSGDKGDTSNIGVIARHPDLLDWLRDSLTPEQVAGWLAHLVRGPVSRYELPGIHAFNFVCEQALGGGGMASLRNDPLGKGMAQILLCMPVRVPAALLSRLA